MLTEAEEVKWRSEQRLEMLSAPSADYTPPRLVVRCPFFYDLETDDNKNGVLVVELDADHKIVFADAVIVISIVIFFSLFTNTKMLMKKERV